MWAKKIDATADGFSSKQDNLLGKTPDLIFLFEVSDAHDQGASVGQLSDIFPDVPIVGCSTGTIIEGDTLSDRGATAMAIGFERTHFRVATQAIRGSWDSQAIGLALGLQLQASDLTAVLVLADGLHMNGSALVSGLAEAVGSKVAISGGLAGDGARFEYTFVHGNHLSQSKLVAAIGFYGPAIRIAHGYASGWEVFGPNRVITRSEDNVLYELDGKPALDLYERYLGEEAAGLPASALFYPLQIWQPDQPDHKVVRTILSVDHDARSMTFAGDVPQAWKARLMRGRLDNLIESATDAAQLAMSALKKVGASLNPSLCVTVSCVGRRLLLGQRAEEEVKGVADVLGEGVAHIGFYSYGEIAPRSDSVLCNLHNQTLTLTLMAEAD